MTENNATPPPEGQPQQPQGQPQYQQQPQGQPTPAQGVSESDERTMGLLTHISAILLGLIGPLIFWLIYRERSAFLNDQGKEALNFNILVAIVYVGLSVLSVITLGFGTLLFPLVWIAALVFQIIGGLAANKHENYRYPLNWRIIK
ncbi:DUF4870 domain-containing protein [Demequina sediminicola]|uniref:DUF4870 domain-containing protein n=1 Tax=Demequina sediminicola TaxID=1095026 RepID=UPI0009E645F4|nr:DUF4870 domain-containing protein [Demequina sediminicola]